MQANTNWSLIAAVGCCALLGGIAHAFSSEPAISATRQLSVPTAGPGEVVTVTITVEVGDIGSDPIRGLFVSDYVPEGLDPTAGAVSVDGSPATVTREQDPGGTLHPGATTERWVFETPPSWPEDRPVDAQRTIVVSYDVTIPLDAPTGEQRFPGFGWTAMIAAQGDAGDQFGYEGAPVALSVVDDRAPQLASSAAYGLPTVVTVRFDEAVDEATAADAANYVIDNGIIVDAAAMEGERTVALSVSALSEGVTYTLTVNGVTDVSANAIAPDSQDTFVFTRSLVLHWALDDGGGSVAADGSPSGHDGAITGATWTTGRVGGALSFDGSDDCVAAAITAWDAPSYTVCLWARAAAVAQPEWASVFNNAPTAADDSMQIDVDGGNPGLYRVHFKDVKASLGAVTTEWRHLAVTYDGELVKGYLDGQLGLATPVEHAKAGTLFRQFVLGRNRAANLYFAGDLDDLRVYDQALARAAIAELASMGP